MQDEVSFAYEAKKKADLALVDLHKLMSNRAQAEREFTVMQKGKRLEVLAVQSGPEGNGALKVTVA